METPELDKLVAVSKESQACGEFFDWLCYEKGVQMTRSVMEPKNERPCLRCDGKGRIPRGEDCRRCGATGKVNDGMVSFDVGVYGVQDLLAEFFEIDMDKVEQERRMILDSLRGEST